MPEATILCVESEPTILATLALVLRSENYDVVTAATGEQALSLFSNPAIAAVLVGCCLPDLAVTELARRMRALRPEVGIVLYSAHAHTGDQDAPVQAVVDKPASPQELLAALRQVMPKG